MWALSCRARSGVRAATSRIARPGSRSRRPSNHRPDQRCRQDGIDLDLDGLKADASRTICPSTSGRAFELNLPAPRGRNGLRRAKPAAPGDRSRANEPSGAVDALEPAGGLAKAPERVDELEDADTVDPVGDLEPADALDAADALEPIDMPQPVDEPEPLDAAEPEEQALPERFYVAEDSSPLVAARSEMSPLSTLPLLDVESDPDDRPPSRSASCPRCPRRWRASKQPQNQRRPRRSTPVPSRSTTRGHAPVRPSSTARTARPIAGMKRGSRAASPTWESEFPEAAALTGPIRSRPKVFPRADIVSTADVTAIDGRFELRLISALVAPAGSTTRSGCPSRPSSLWRSLRLRPRITDRAQTRSRVAPTTRIRRRQSRDLPPGRRTPTLLTLPIRRRPPLHSPLRRPAGIASPSDSTPTPAISTQVEAPANPMRDAADRSSEEGMARPAGPQSISPFQPSRSLRSRPTSVKSPRALPRGGSSL